MQLILFETIQRNSSISFPMFGNTKLDPPSFFTVFGRPIYFYGVLIALGFALAILYCSKHAPDFGIESDDFVDLMLWLTPLSILGARLYFVAFRWRDYAGDLRQIFAVWEGGLAIYGGIIAGVLVILAVCRHKKIPVAAMLDLAVYGVLIGQILGRWGNFMNREAYGAATDLPWRMRLWTSDTTFIDVHPTFLYESLWNLLGLALLYFIVTKKRRFDGENTCFYFLWYGLGRFWIEGLRADSLYLFDLTLFGARVRVSQALSLVLILVSAGILFYQLRVRRVSADGLWVNRQAAKSAAGAPEQEEKPAQ